MKSQATLVTWLLALTFSNAPQAVNDDAAAARKAGTCGRLPTFAVSSLVSACEDRALSSRGKVSSPLAKKGPGLKPPRFETNNIVYMLFYLGSPLFSQVNKIFHYIRIQNSVSLSLIVGNWGFC